MRHDPKVDSQVADIFVTYEYQGLAAARRAYNALEPELQKTLALYQSFFEFSVNYTWMMQHLGRS